VSGSKGGRKTNLAGFTNAYGVVQLTAVVTFLLLLELRLRPRGASLGGCSWLVAVAVLAAGIGERLHSVVEGVLSERIALENLPPALCLRSAGPTFFGAIGAVALVLFLLRRWVPGRSLRRLADDAVYGLGVAILIGRLGCLLQGCCLGEVRTLPWGLRAGLHGGDGSTLYHPLPLYIGFWGITSALVATRLARRFPASPGTTTLLFATLFCLGRGFLESYRLGSGRLLLEGGWGQTEAFVLATITGGLLLLRPRYRPARPIAPNRSF